MGTDTRDLILQLFTSVGMIAEDLAGLAISSISAEGPDLVLLLEHTRAEIGRSGVLIEAALALFDHELEGRNRLRDTRRSD